EIVSSFAGSGTITNQIILGVPAHLALVSLELDADKLAGAGVLASGSWRRLPFEGIVNRTPFIILVRPGNPKGIRHFEDLPRSRGRLKAAVVYPRSTVLSEHTLVRIDRNIARREADLVDAFARFLFTEEAQRVFVRYGFRSVTESLNEANPAFGRIEDPFRIG